jgi:hypothetical protein
MRPALLREAATMRWRGEFWDLYFRCEGKYWRPFRFPATLPTSALLEPIASPMDMEAEGLLMKNCMPSLISRVQSGDRLYFRTRDNFSVNAELIKEPRGWVPGDILWLENAPVPDSLATAVRNELVRMGGAITDSATDSAKTDGYLDSLRHKVRETFGKADVAVVAQHLASIQGKSQSWTDGAYLILGMPRGRGFIQFMCSPNGKEYLCEIQSYKYEMRLGEYLDADAVDLIEKAGFVWPTNRANFVRWFKGSSPEESQGIAEFALAAHHSLFRCRSIDQLEVKVHIPEDESGG